MKFGLGALLALSLPLWAGIRIIHGGGGDAEMQALTFGSRMPSLIQVCLTSSEKCQLLANEMAFLKEISADVIPWSRLQLEFFDSTKLIYIPSRSLYDGAEQAKPAEEIGALVFQAVVGQPALASLRLKYGLDNLNGLQQLGRKLTRSFSLRKQTVQLSKARLHVHTISSNLSSTSEIWMGVETSNQMLDTTGTVHQALSCKSASPRLTKIEGLHEEDGVAVARIAWTCQGRSYTGRLLLTENESGTLSAQVRSVSQPCAKDLE